MCERVGKTADAEHSYRRAYAIARATLAADDPLVATSEQNLREFRLATGRPFERESPAVEQSMASELLPQDDPIADFDPPLERAVPSGALEQQSGTATTMSAAGTSPAPPLVPTPQVVPAQNPESPPLSLPSRATAGAAICGGSQRVSAAR